MSEKLNEFLELVRKSIEGDKKEFKPQPLLEKCDIVKVLLSKNWGSNRKGEIINYKYKPRLEQSIIECDFYNILGFYDKKEKRIDVNVEELKKYNYIHEQRKDICECNICKNTPRTSTEAIKIIKEGIEGKRKEQLKRIEGKKEEQPKEEDKLKKCINVLTEREKSIPPEDILNVLRNENLFNEITEEELSKEIEGEVESRKVIFLCSAGGRLIKNSQIASYNLLVNDDAGVGKDFVVRRVLKIIPKEFYVHRTRISPAVLTYWHNSKYEPDWTWDNKVFYSEDISEAVLNSDVFKVMCSSGSSATIVIKGRAVDIDIVGKPVMVVTTATAVPNSEVTRRFVFLNLDSSEGQTNAIKRRHSKYAMKGLISEYNEKYIEAQKYLKRVKVKIPYADLIDKYFPDKSLIMRTNYPRFLDFIKASAGFHQYQREEDNEGYIIATGQDYNIARDCFIKLSSNKYMIPLTINQKKILKVFEENPYLKGSATKLHQQINFLSLPALQTNLGILVKYGLLESSSELDTWNKEIEVYFLSKGYNPNEKIELPNFEKIGYEKGDKNAE